MSKPKNPDRRDAFAPVLKSVMAGQRQYSGHKPAPGSFFSINPRQPGDTGPKPKGKGRPRG